jgi:hypothetical protein
MNKKREGMRQIRTLEKGIEELRVVKNELGEELDKMETNIKGMKFALKYEKFSFLKKMKLKKLLIETERVYKKSRKTHIEVDEKYYERRLLVDDLIKRIKKEIELDKQVQGGITLSR